MSAVIDHSNGTALDALESIGDATPKQRAAAKRVVLRQPDARDLMPYLFGTPRREGERAGLRQQRAAERIQQAADGAPAREAAVDPAYSAHPPEDIGVFRAQVCDWGRDKGWPDVSSRQVLPADLVAAYREAHPRGGA